MSDIPKISRCPKCGDNTLEFVNNSAMFDCGNRFCGQRMDRTDYIKWAIKNFHSRINTKSIFKECLNGVNKEWTMEKIKNVKIVNIGRMILLENRVKVVFLLER